MMRELESYCRTVNSSRGNVEDEWQNVKKVTGSCKGGDLVMSIARGEMTGLMRMWKKEMVLW
jgi:hypothetical protein